MEKARESKSGKFAYNLQLFADGDGAGDQTGGAGAGNAGGGQQQQATQQQQQVQQPSGRIYTEDELKGIRSEAGRNAQREVLKRLGITDRSNADALFKEIQAFVASRKTPEQQANEKVEEAEQRAIRAEAKVEALIAGVKPDCLDDIITIAAARAGDGKQMKDVFAELKKKYPAQFVEDGNVGGGKANDGNNDDETDGGTGAAVGNGGNKGGSGGDGNKKDNFGSLLAKDVNAARKKKSFFAR